MNMKTMITSLVISTIASTLLFAQSNKADNEDTGSKHMSNDSCLITLDRISSLKDIKEMYLKEGNLDSAKEVQVTIDNLIITTSICEGNLLGSTDDQDVQPCSNNGSFRPCTEARKDA